MESSRLKSSKYAASALACMIAGYSNSRRIDGVMDTEDSRSWFEGVAGSDFMKIVNMMTGGANTTNDPWFRRPELYSFVINPALKILKSIDPPIQNHRSFCATFAANDFKDSQITTGIESIKFSETTEGASCPISFMTSFDSEISRVKSYKARLGVLRQQLINDRSLGFFANCANSIIASAYNLEARSVYSILESNPNLGSDGLPLFSSGNSVAAPTVDKAVYAGISSLYGQKADASGDPLGLHPFVIALPHTWYELSQALVDRLDRENVTLIFDSRISSGYVFADPKQYASIGILSLDRNAKPTLEVKSRSDFRGNCDDDVEMVVTCDTSFSVVPVSRKGIVRVQVQ